MDVVHGGEKATLEESAQKTKGAQKAVSQKPKEPAQAENGDNLKRKASVISEPVVEDPDKPLSKREIKRRAKKAKFDAKGENAT